MARDMKTYIHELLKSGEDTQNFGSWAFGDDFEELEDGLQFMNKWNHLHEHELKLYETGVLEDDMPRMISLWKGIPHKFS